MLENWEEIDTETIKNFYDSFQGRQVTSNRGAIIVYRFFDQQLYLEKLIS